MQRQYLNQNVYEALQSRLHFIFQEFQNIFVSFSGGKDSGLLLNLVLDFRKKYYPNRRIGVFHQDFEAQYSVTTEYIERTFARIEKEVEPYWVCLPMATRTALSNYEMYWYPWDDEKEEAWVRPMPKHPYVINLRNNPITTYRYKMHQEDLARQFCRWYRMRHGNKKTVCLLGIRADESLQRYRGFLNRKCGYQNTCWISSQFKNVWTASPMYDWTTSDVWHANAVFHYDYNRLYDLYHMAGLRPSQMRVASPFNDYAKESLNLYRVIDPQIWVKLVGRVQGANFAAIYGKSKALGYRNITLPKGHTWESYTRFLLATLPALPSEKLYGEIPNLHPLLAHRGRWSGGANHPGAGRTRLRHPPQRRVQLHSHEAFPDHFPGKDPGSHRRHQIHQRHSQLEAYVLLHPEK